MSHLLGNVHNSHILWLEHIACKCALCALGNVWHVLRLVRSVACDVLEFHVQSLKQQIKPKHSEIPQDMIIDISDMFD